MGGNVKIMIGACLMMKEGSVPIPWCDKKGLDGGRSTWLTHMKILKAAKSKYTN